jgi:hypothetical protein
MTENSQTPRRSDACDTQTPARQGLLQRSNVPKSPDWRTNAPNTVAIRRMLVDRRWGILRSPRPLPGKRTPPPRRLDSAAIRLGRTRGPEFTSVKAGARLPHVSLREDVGRIDDADK